MRFRQRHNLPQLLALLSAPQRQFGLGGWGSAQQAGLARLQNLLRLGKLGLREYSDKLDSIDRRLLRGEWKRDEEPRDEEPSHHEEYTREEYTRDDEPETFRLSRSQIHRLFERLAIHRHSLNARGYPYTSDVNQEREEIYRDSDPLDGREVEEAWDDWKDDRARKFFSRHRGAYDRSEARENEGAGERRFRYADREELALFSDLVRAAIERAFDDLEKTRHHREPVVRVAPDAGRDERDGDSHRRVDGQQRRREVGGTPAQHCTFSIFDEILLNFDGPESAFAPENLLLLSEINRRLGECGEPPFDHEDAMRREWIAYVVSAATERKRSATCESRKPDEEITETVVLETDVRDSTRADNGHAFRVPGRRNKLKSSIRDL
jgi:hypothetical protein